MTAEPSDSGGAAALPNGSSPAKRGRGRPKGSLNKKKLIMSPRTIDPRVPKVVQLFCAAIPTEKLRRPCRPKKFKLRGRPRKTPMSAEEEEEMWERQQKRHRWKRLGRPRIHPVVDPKKKRKPGRVGRPRKYPHSPSRAPPPAAIVGSPTKTAAEPVVKRGRGRLPGCSPSKRRATHLSHKKKTTPVPEGAASPRKRGRPSGSGKIQKIRQQEADDSSKQVTPKKRGRPPGSKTPEVEKPKSGGKRGRPSGALGKKRRKLEKSFEDGEQLNLEPEEEEEVEAGQAATAANGDTESEPVENEAELGAGGGEEDGAGGGEEDGAEGGEEDGAGGGDEDGAGAGEEDGAGAGEEDGAGGGDKGGDEDGAGDGDKGGDEDGAGAGYGYGGHGSSAIVNQVANAIALDAADGKLDGKFYGHKIKW